ncbi:MAG: HAD family phosphatase [Balneolaceae bacterium]
MPETIGVIFDMDGVIVHSNPTHKKAIQIFCDKFDIEVSDSFLEKKVYGRTNKEWIPELFGEITSERQTTLANEKEQLFRNMFNPEDFVVDGLHAFLDALRSENISMAVATSAPVENADYILSRLSIRDYFNTVLDSSHITTGKPDPEVYVKAAKALGKKPESCIVFEDSLAGVEAGLKAGCKVIGITTTHSPEELENCHLVVQNFENLSLEDLLRL